MVKRFVVLSVVLLFAIGAVGGCLNQTPPNLSGTWGGDLSRSLNPTVQNFARVTIVLQQAPNNQFSGTVNVTYNPNSSNPIYLPEATINPSKSSTNEWGATIETNEVSTQSEILIPCGNVTLTIPTNQNFKFTFVIPHFYACRGENLTELTGTYSLTVGGNIIDSGAVTLVKQ